jgi:hypothetical protein
MELLNGLTGLTRRLTGREDLTAGRKSETQHIETIDSQFRICVQVSRMVLESPDQHPM